MARQSSTIVAHLFCAFRCSRMMDRVAADRFAPNRMNVRARALIQFLATVADPRASDELQLQQLAEEQAALRRVATLVARGPETETLFAVVAEQVAAVLRAQLVRIIRYEPDGSASERASYS